MTPGFYLFIPFLTETQMSPAKNHSSNKLHEKDHKTNIIPKNFVLEQLRFSFAVLSTMRFIYDLKRQKSTKIKDKETFLKTNKIKVIKAIICELKALIKKLIIQTKHKPTNVGRITTGKAI